MIVDGVPFDVPAAATNPGQGPGGSQSSKAFDVPAGKLFVLGDNRPDSCDSQVWEDPFVPIDSVGLDALLERLAAQRIEHEPIETYSNGGRHVNVPDPDGNAIAFAEPPDAASASPRSAGTGASRS